MSSSSTSVLAFLTSSSALFASSSTGSSNDTSLTIAEQDAIYYHYIPSAAFAVVAFVVFGLLAVLLTAQTLRFHKGGWFTSILAVGATLEAVGYILRYILTKHWNTNVFIVSYVLILVTPNFFAFVNYSAVGRLLRSLPTKPREPTWLRIPIITDSTGVFRPNRIAGFFLMSDVLAFFIQASAAAWLTSSDPSKIKTGQTVIEIGLAWGLAFIGLFFFVTIFVYVSSTYAIRSHPQYELIRRMYISLFVTITLLLIRSIYRMVEYTTGQTSYVSSHEWVFGIFDTMLMALACVFYAASPYSQYLAVIKLPGVAPDNGGKTEMVTVRVS